MNLNNLNKTFIVAEIGINHNGSKKRLFQMIDAAKKTGADAVKLQIMTGSDLVVPGLSFSYTSKGVQKTTDLAKLFYDCRVKLEWLPEIYDYCKNQDIICFATPFSFDVVDILEEVGNPIYKVSSGDISHLPLLSYIAKTNKPMIVSTGKSSLGDVERAVDQIRAAGNKNLALLHCVSLYPTPYDELNLRNIATLKQAFDVQVGFSDHSEGYISSVVAVALGSKIIEKHFTLDKNDEGPDHWFSLDKAEFSTLVKNIRLTESMLGSGVKQIADNEKRVNERASRSIVAKKRLNKGDRLSAEMFEYKRPGNGLRPYQESLLIGKILNKDLAKDDLITLEDIEW